MIRIIKGTGDDLKVNAVNRGYRSRPLQNLKVSMQNVGFLKSKPILTSGNLTIIDGHHRFEAANQLGIPYYYMVDDTITRKNTVDYLVAIELGTKKWTFSDWLKYWCDDKKPDYITIRKYVNQAIPISALLEIACGTRDSKMFASGKFKITNPYFDKVVARYITLRDTVTFKMGAAEIKAIFRIQKVYEEFELDELIRQVCKYPNMWKKSTSWREAVIDIEKIWNYNRSKSKRAYFAHVLTINGS